MPKRGQQKGTASRRAEFIVQLRGLEEGSECVYWPWSDIRGQYVSAHINGEMRRVHRWVYEQIHDVQLERGSIGPGVDVIMHTCDNPACCNPRHLVHGSAQENTMDAVRKGRLKYNHTGSGATKITLDQVEIIKRMSEQGVRYSVIARVFDVSGTTISEIARGKSRAGASREKLTDADRVEVRRLAAIPGMRQAHIAQAYGVCDTTISFIVKGRPPR